MKMSHKSIDKGLPIQELIKLEFVCKKRNKKMNVYQRLDAWHKLQTPQPNTEKNQLEDLLPLQKEEESQNADETTTDFLNFTIGPVF